MTMATWGIFQRTAVFNSCAVYRKPPSPGAQADAQTHPEPAVSAIIEERLGNLEVEPVVAHAGTDAGVYRHHAIARQHFSQLGKNALRQHGIAREVLFGAQTGLALFLEYRDLAAPL